LGRGEGWYAGGERIKALVLLLLFLFPLPFQNEKEEGAEKEEVKQIASFAGTFLPPPPSAAAPLPRIDYAMLIIHRIINLNLRLRRVKRGAASLRVVKRKKSCFAGPHFLYIKRKEGGWFAGGDKEEAKLPLSL